MPTYEYHCETCDRNFDVVQSFHDAPLDACPTCGAPVRKVFGNVGIVFKGSGFYKTDSRAPAKTGGGTTTKAEGDAASSDGSGSDGSGSDGSSKDSGAGAESAPAKPAKDKPASTPAPAPSSSANGTRQGAKESATT